MRTEPLGGDWRSAARIQVRARRAGRPAPPERRGTDRLFQLLFEMADVLSHSEDLNEALRASLRLICEHLLWERGEFWTVDPDRRVAWRQATWQRPGVEVSAFESGTGSLCFAPGEGLIGRVWERAAPEWVPNMLADAPSGLSRYAAAVGLRAAFAFPWVVAGNVTGVAAFYSSCIREPEPRMLALFSSVAAQLGQFLERKKMHRELEIQLHRMRLLNRITRAIVERQDPEGMYREAVGCLEEGLGVDFAAVMLLDSSGEALRLSCPGERALELLGPKGLREGDEFLRGPSIARDPALQLREHLGSWGLESIEMATMEVADRPVGVLVVADRQADVFDGRFGEFLSCVVEHVSIAALHGRLHRDLEAAYREVKETQQAVVQQERLNALGRMASGIVHDINNALSPIVGYPDLVLGLHPDLDPRAREGLDAIRASGEDIARLAGRLRDFYRRRDQAEPHRPFPADRAMQHAIDVTRPRWRDLPMRRGHVIDVSLHVQKRLPDIIGDESEVRQALANLILNSVDALPAGGGIRLAASSRGNRVVLEVSDDGTGMDEETLQRCMEPFFSTKGEAGTGLGMAMVFGVVERHQGEMEIQSEPGRGTTARISLPAARSKAVGGEETTGTCQPRAPLNLLVIDDEPVVRRLLKQLLEHEYHRVVLAPDGQAGLQLFLAACGTDRRFDVVFTDLGMPHMNGLEVAAAVKQASPLTPVILLSGWGNGSAGAPEKLVDLVLAKPPRLAALRDALVSVCGCARPADGDARRIGNQQPAGESAGV